MGKALICYQILLTNSCRKCMEISLESLYLDTGAQLKGLTGQSWHVLKSRYTGGAQNKDFGAVSLADLTKGQFRLWHRLGTSRGNFASTNQKHYADLSTCSDLPLVWQLRIMQGYQFWSHKILAVFSVQLWLNYIFALA